MYVLVNALVKIRVHPNTIFCFDKSIKDQVTKKYFTKTELAFMVYKTSGTEIHILANYYNTLLSNLLPSFQGN